MAGPTLLGIRDVKDPYEGLQDAVKNAGSIYHAYQQETRAAEELRLRQEQEKALARQRAIDNRFKTVEQERVGEEHALRLGVYAREEKDRDIYARFTPSDVRLESEAFDPRVWAQIKQAEDAYAQENLIKQASGGEYLSDEELDALYQKNRWSFATAEGVSPVLENYLRSQGASLDTVTSLVSGATRGMASRAGLVAQEDARVTSEADRAQSLRDHASKLLELQVNLQSRSGGGGGGGGGLAGIPGDISPAEQKAYDDALYEVLGSYNDGPAAIGSIKGGLAGINQLRADRGLPPLQLQDINGPVNALTVRKGSFGNSKFAITDPAEFMQYLIDQGYDTATRVSGRPLGFLSNEVVQELVDELRNRQVPAARPLGQLLQDRIGSLMEAAGYKLQDSAASTPPRRLTNTQEREEAARLPYGLPRPAAIEDPQPGPPEDPPYQNNPAGIVTAPSLDLAKPFEVNLGADGLPKGMSPREVRELNRLRSAIASPSTSEEDVQRARNRIEEIMSTDYEHRNLLVAADRLDYTIRSLDNTSKNQPPGAMYTPPVLPPNELAAHGFIESSRRLSQGGLTEDREELHRGVVDKYREANPRMAAILESRYLRESPRQEKAEEPPVAVDRSSISRSSWAAAEAAQAELFRNSPEAQNYSPRTWNDKLQQEYIAARSRGEASDYETFLQERLAALAPRDLPAAGGPLSQEQAAVQRRDIPRRDGWQETDPSLRSFNRENVMEELRASVYVDWIEAGRPGDFESYFNRYVQSNWE